jgi:hypothetical protein
MLAINFYVILLHLHLYNFPLYSTKRNQTYLVSGPSSCDPDVSVLVLSPLYSVYTVPIELLLPSDKPNLCQTLWSRLHVLFTNLHESTHLSRSSRNIPQGYFPLPHWWTSSYLWPRLWRAFLRHRSDLFGLLGV